MKWWEKPLEQMTGDEWERLCDGCGRCCMHKFEDEDSGCMLYTDVACRLFDAESCRCTRYSQRLLQVEQCLDVRGFSASMMQWLPRDCAYRLLSEGRPLPSWHPLVSGDPESVHRAGISMRDRAISEADVPEDEIVQHVLVGSR